MEIEPSVKTDLIELLTLTKKLCFMDCIPENRKRQLDDDKIKRLFSSEIWAIIERVSVLVDCYGTEFKYRHIICETAKGIGIDVSFKPFEQDSFGWVTAGFMTPKGYFFF